MPPTVRPGTERSDREYRPVVVAVVAVRPVQPSLYQIVHVVSVRDRVVPAPLVVSMRGVTRHRVRMTRRVLRIDLDRVLIDMVTVRMVQMTVVDVIDMVPMAYRRMPATRSVLMLVRSLMRVVAHAQRLARPVFPKPRWPRAVMACTDGSGRCRGPCGAGRLALRHATGP